MMNPSDHLYRRLARRFRTLNWLWLVLSLVQVVSCVGIIAAAWNLYVLYQRWRVPELLRRGDPAIAGLYRNDEGWFISFLVINLALGGVVGAALIAYEFIWIRAPLRRQVNQLVTS
jgi:hypothetical protein